MSDEWAPPKRTFLQRLTFSGGSGGAAQQQQQQQQAAAGASASSSAASSGTASPASSKTRSVSSHGQAGSGGGRSNGGATAGGHANPFADVDERGEEDAGGQRRKGSDQQQGYEEEDEDGDEEDEEEPLSEEAVALASRDFTAMRRRLTSAAASSAAASSARAPATREELRVSASIISADNSRDVHGKGTEFVLYTIAVSTGGPAGLHWKVGRRFREFEQLHAQLVAKFGKDRFTLPKKALIRNLEPEYVRKKKAELAKYLRDVMLDPEVSNSEELSHFLISSLQDVIRGSLENMRVFALRGMDCQRMERDVERLKQERNKAQRDAMDSRRERDSAHQQMEEAQAAMADMKTQEAATLAAAEQRVRDALAAEHAQAMQTLREEWEAKYAELAVHTKAALKDKKAALRAVQDLDAQCRKLKAEKKILVKEVKEQRARQAAEGALGGVGAAASEAARAAPDDAGDTGTHTPAPVVRSTAASPGLSSQPDSFSSAAASADGSLSLTLASGSSSPARASSPSASPDPHAEALSVSAMLLSPSPVASPTADEGTHIAHAALADSPTSATAADGGGVHTLMERQETQGSEGGEAEAEAEAAAEARLSTPRM